MSTTTEQKFTGREFRFLADNYEQAQRLRVETGERIRAVVQGRDATFIPLGQIITPEKDEPFWIDENGVSRMAEATVKAIQRGETLGPVVMLGRSHHRYWTEERETEHDMLHALKYHPAWPWLTRVRGIGPTLAAKLVARLDPTIAFRR